MSSAPPSASRLPEGALERLIRRRDRKRRNQRIAAGVVGIAVFVAAFGIVTNACHSIAPRRRRFRGGAAAERAPFGTVPETDYLLDLNTGEMTPLPDSIVGTEDLTGGYAVSPDGSKLAYVGPGDNGERRIFVANLDGTGVEQVTNEEATEPVWSPDGSKIAYIGSPGAMATTSSCWTSQRARPRSSRTTPAEGCEQRAFLLSGWMVPPLRRLRRVYEVMGRQVRMVPTLGGESVPWGAVVPLSSRRMDRSWPTAARGVTICLANPDGTDARVLLGLSDPDGDPAVVSRRNTDRVQHVLFVPGGSYVVDVATSEQTNVADGVSSGLARRSHPHRGAHQLPRAAVELGEMPGLSPRAPSDEWA